MEYEILVLDDEPMTNELLLEVSTSHLQLPLGHTIRVTWADTADEGRELIAAGKWHIIFCDLYFANAPAPMEVGLELIRQADAKRKSKSDEDELLMLAVYALTQYSKDQRMHQAATTAGVDGIIGKSTTSRRLAEIIAEKLKLSGGANVSSPRGGVTVFRLLTRWMRCGLINAR